MIDIYRHYREFAKRKGLPWIDPAPLVNEVDDQDFNYSLEEPILREFGGFLDINHYHDIATVQPCIRGGDVNRIRRGESYNHTVLFNIFPLAFPLLPNVADLERYHRKAIKNVVTFIKEVGLDLGKLRVTYFAGGNIYDISKGRVLVKKSFPEDRVTLESFLDEGLRKSQLEPVASLDTFVATFAGNGDFYAGPRYEIFYPLGNGGLLEIGTGEALPYRQVREKETTIDIMPASCAVAPVALGLERVQAALENTDNISSVSTFRLLGNKLSPLLKGGDKRNGLRAANFFRAAHVVLSQTHKVRLSGSLSSRRRVIISELCSMLSTKRCRLSEYVEALDLNAELLPWIPGLNNNTEVVAEVLIENLQRRSSR